LPEASAIQATQCGPRSSDFTSRDEFRSDIRASYTRRLAAARD